MLTMGEFAARYGIQRVDVNAAVRMNGVEPLPEEKRGAYGRYACLYREKDLAKAVIAYYRDKRQYYIRKAHDWTERANAIAAHYKEGQA